MTNPLRIGTRGSALALWQAHHVKHLLEEQGASAELVIIKTRGDQIQHLSFDKMEGKGFFTKEIEQALLDGAVDLAVHSFKDLETTGPPELVVEATPAREIPNDLLLINPSAFDQGQRLWLKTAAVVGTSSIRRQSQIGLLRPDLQFAQLRGNVPTRLARLLAGDYDAIVLAEAGLSRLALETKPAIKKVLHSIHCVPAAAQGALALQCRKTDHATRALLRQLGHATAARSANTEREALALIGGGCQMPTGIALDQENNLRIHTVRQALPHRAVVPMNEFANTAAAINEWMQWRQPKNLLITKTLETDSLLRRWCQMHSIGLCQVPFIETRATSAEILPSAHWLFFTSAASVRHFVELYGAEKLKAFKLAAMGSATATALRQHTPVVQFVGEGSPEKVAADLSEIVETDLVLFPRAVQSLRTVQRLLPASQVLEVMVYETIYCTKEAPSAEAYCFTSPSNVRSFYTQGHRPAAGSVCIALGTATAEALREAGAQRIRTASLPDECEIINLLENRFS